MRKQWEVKNIS